MMILPTLFYFKEGINYLIDKDHQCLIQLEIQTERLEINHVFCFGVATDVYLCQQMDHSLHF